AFFSRSQDRASSGVPIRSFVGICLRRCNMTAIWKQFEGQLVDDEFPLQQLLAGDEHNAVFLTQRGDSTPQKATIKLLPLDPATVDLQLSRWRLVAQLAHPNLLHLHDFGRCRLGDANFLY